MVFGRKQQRTQTQQLMDELAESYGHLKLAAGHVAGGAAEKLTPPYDKARNAADRTAGSTTKDAFAPLYVQMREGAANARKEQEVPRRTGGRCWSGCSPRAPRWARPGPWSPAAAVRRRSGTSTTRCPPLGRRRTLRGLADKVAAGPRRPTCVQRGRQGRRPPARRDGRPTPPCRARPARSERRLAVPRAGVDRKPADGSRHRPDKAVLGTRRPRHLADDRRPPSGYSQPERRNRR